MPTDAHDRSRRAGAAAVAVIGAALTLAAAGCGSSGTSSPQPAASGAAATHHPMASHSHAMAESMAFGPDCGMVPTTGMGSFHSMSMDPAVTAASHNPLLTSFAADVKAAGLTSELDSMHAVTIFAPANSAFSKLTASEMSMMHSTPELAKILRYHIVSGRVTPAELASGKPLKTVEGDSLTGSKMGSVYEVNSAHVVCGNIQAANATIYVISKVLTPMH
jgi:uncharacterized surface protein with fasciclin (FAS1) repeats